MGDKKLFGLLEGTPVDTDKLVFGKVGSPFKNITMPNFKSYLADNELKHITSPIGAWNMDTSASSGIIGLFLPYPPGTIFPPSIQQTQIRTVNVIIIYDNGLAHSDFLSVQDGTASNVPMIQMNQWTFISNYAYVFLTRRTNSVYDGTNYQKTTNPDSSPYNRGWVTVGYE